MCVDDKFEIDDTIEEINKNSKTIQMISSYEADGINTRIFDKMGEVDLEFRMKNAGSNESAEHSYITF